MKNIKILDCTLRDGGYLVNKKFGSNVIKGMISHLTDARVDIVEVGFLQTEPGESGSTVFRSADAVKNYLPQVRNNTMYVALADFSRYNIDLLEACDNKSIDGIRACFFKNERKEVIDFCIRIKQLGYKVFVQPVDILGYTDSEILDLLDDVNSILPYAFSVVDTFGSMYFDDLERIFYLIHHNLEKSVNLGFHSHNNMQMSFALAQRFIELAAGKRNAFVDSTMCGMGRGAGNTNTELIAQFMNRKLEANYDLDILMDIVDIYMNSLMAKCTWGYSIPYFLAGVFSAHVNNISYLLNKSTIKMKDLRHILNGLGMEQRKRYDYELLEEECKSYFASAIDMPIDYSELKKIFSNKDVLMLLPGYSIKKYKKDIMKFINEKKPIVIAINFCDEEFKLDYLYFNNVQRYEFWKTDEKIKKYKLILTTNVTRKDEIADYVIPYIDLIKCGLEKADNSAIMFLRLLDKLKVNKIYIAGFDGFSTNKSNYAADYLEAVRGNVDKENRDILNVFIDYLATRESDVDIKFITPSIFEEAL